MRILELHQLDQPFDVREPSAAELDVARRISPARKPLRLHTCFDASDLAHLGVGGFLGIADTVHQLHEVIGELITAGQRPGAQQSLPLPDLHPPAIILGEGVQGPGERTVLALGAQARIQLQRILAADGRPLGEQGPQPRRQLLSLGVSLGRVAALRRAVDEEGVHIGAVGDLAPALPAHGHDQKVDVLALLREHLTLCHMQRAQRGRAVGIRERGADLLDIQVADGIRDGHPQHLALSDQTDQSHCGSGVCLMPEQRIPDLAPELIEAAWCQVLVLAEPLGGLRGVLQLVRDESGAGQDVAEPLSSHGGVPQHGQIPGTGAQRLAEPTEGEQPGVGVHSFGEPAQHHRQNPALQRGPSAHSGGQRLDMAHGPAGVGIAQCRQTLLGRLRREPGVLVGQHRCGGEQRPVEDRLVEGRDLADDPPPLLVQSLGARSPQRTGRLHRRGQGPQLGLLFRHQVGASHLRHLDPMLVEAQLPVAARHRVTVPAGHVLALGQSVDGRQRVTDPQSLIDAPVDQLQQLNGELHVPQSPATEFQLPVSRGGRNVLEDPTAHPLDVLHEALLLR